jgi:hypothetical protein
MSFTCEFCKEVEVAESNMICDECAEKEIKAQDLNERIADYYNEQHRLRYQDIHIFDNDVDEISVTYKRKVLRRWRYTTEGHNFFDQGRPDVMLTAKGYIEGWLDAIDVKSAR